MSIPNIWYNNNNKDNDNDKDNNNNNDIFSSVA